MNRWLQLITGVAAILAAIIGTPLTTDNRYAKSQEVHRANA